MRAGGCTVQQALTADATSLVKQAVALARRRGHAQVTPLHVASTMLSSPTGLLRTACLQSHSHPLQCKALELCFNVALNRLPTSTSSPMLGGHVSPFPSISNALVAAFKRAQAHQRRGSIENQQQPILAVKIELEQLIISILDDPSVSRVMREAGFSSTQVKSNVEQAVSFEICSKTTSSVTSKSKESGNGLSLSQSPQTQTKPPAIKNEDVMYVIDNFANKKRRNFTLVGECLDTIDGVIRAVMEKVDKRDVPEVLRDVKFITLSFSSFGHLSRVEVEQKLRELKSLVRSCISKGVILNLGDLNWVVENRARSSGDQQGRGYSAIEHMIMDLGKLACGLGENARLWLMGIATFQTYMRCKSGYPSLESVWCLHPLTIPAGGLRLSLIADSDLQSDQSTANRVENGSRWLLLEGREDKNHQLTCCADCSSNFEVEARNLTGCNSSTSDSSSATLPAWLRQYKNENRLHSNNDKVSLCQDNVSLGDLCIKWNSICSSMHKQAHSSSAEKALKFPSLSPCSSTSSFSYELQHPTFPHAICDKPGFDPKNHQFLISEVPNSGNNMIKPNLRLFIPEHEKDPKLPFPSNPTSTSNSASSGDLMEVDYVHKFRELNADNLTTLCTALEKKVPRQKDVILDIVSTVLRCRSGMVARKGIMIGEHESHKEETWLFFEGTDIEAKEKIARELARLIFGSENNFVSICLSSFSSPRTDSTDDNRNKRSRDEQNCSYIEKFTEAACSNPHKVFFIEDVEQADYSSQIAFKRAIHRGRLKNAAGEDVYLSDAIIILSCESFSSRSRACSPPVKQKSDDPSREEKISSPDQISPRISLDLNLSIDEEIDNDRCIEDIGLLQSVDKRINFKTHQL